MAAHRRTALFYILFTCVFLAGTGINQNARAEIKLKHLTEKNITQFIEKTTKMTSGQSLEASPEEIITYLKRHLSPKARFKSTMKYNIPGYPTQETSMSLEKKDFIESIEDGSQALSDYESEIRVRNIKISKDKTKATVQTTGTEKGIMPLSEDGVTSEDVPVEGTSNCTQIIMLEEGVIQMYSANCTTTIHFLPY